MSSTVTRFKFFWSHQDEQQETWLRSMAQQGLRLVTVHPLCFWTFRRDVPADIVYRIDSPGASQDPSFQQLMQDAGWTLAATTLGWNYWRTPAVGGKAPEMFTDSASKARKFKQRLLVLLTSSLPLSVWLITTDRQMVLDQLSTPFLVALCSALILYLLIVPYTALRLLLRIRSLRDTLPA